MNGFYALVLVSLSCAMTMAQDVTFLGEVHDNPHHHRVQAEHVAKLSPAALVFEMLTPAQADGEVPPYFDEPAQLGEHLGWDASGWPDFSFYAPIFAAAPEARIYGAGVPRDQARKGLAQGLTKSFGPQAKRFGLDQPLPDREQAAREALQMAAHCDALPAEMLPGMVDIQRLRDAGLARAALRALRETGGPVAVITGNGHARADWGAPALLAGAAPGIEIVTLGQTEGGAPLDGMFDTVLSSPAAPRDDPCAAFR